MTDGGSADRSSSLSRRDFLARASAVAAGAAVGTSLVPRQCFAGPESPQTSPPTVVRVRSEHVVHGRRVDQRVLGELLERGLAVATGTSTSAEAWRSLLKPDDVIGLKFNRSAARELGTTIPMAETLIRSLSEAGFAPSRIVPIEAPDAIYRETGTVRPDPRWQTRETLFGSGQDHLAAVLDQVTAIINVPFLKTHNIAGLTGCLKNLSHALVKHPARFHDNHCSPYVADIVALPQIRRKLKLHIANALRVVFDGDPDARQDAVSAPGVLFLSTDPVALDTTGLEEINRQRNQQGLEAVRREGGLLSYLSRAAEVGLGCSDLHQIALTRVWL